MPDWAPASWRAFFFVCTLPNLLSVLFLLFLPDSPRFLLSKGKTTEALRVLQRLYAANSGKEPTQFPVSANNRLHCPTFSSERHGGSTGGRQGVDKGSTRGRRKVDRGSTECRQEVDGWSTGGRRRVEVTSKEGRRKVEGRSTESRGDVEGRSKERRRKVEGTSKEGRRRVNRSRGLRIGVPP